METQKVEEFLEKLRRLYSQMDYYQFLQSTEFVDCDYAMDKFCALRNGISSLCQFDNETLTKLLKQQ